MEYTKWKVRQFGKTYQIYIETPDKPRAKEYQVAEGIYNKANAHLISSAPDLLVALQKMGRQMIEDWEALELVGGHPVNERRKRAIKRAEKAISKARGGS